MASPDTARTWSSSRMSLLLAVLFLLAGGLLVNSTANKFETYSNMSHWPEVSAEVVSSEVIGDRAFRPNVVYSYEIEGVTYVDSTDLNTPSFGGRNNRRAAADSMLSMYPVGLRIFVHYDPEKPAESRLKVSPPWSVYGQLSVGIVLMLLGVLAAMVSVRLKSNRIMRS